MPWPMSSLYYHYNQFRGLRRVCILIRLLYVFINQHVSLVDVLWVDLR